MNKYNVRKALKKFEPRRTKERKEDTSQSSKLHVIDPSHELTQQRNRPSTSAAQQTYIHPLARHSNPELVASPKKWSSSASVTSLDGVPGSAHPTGSPTMAEFEDDLDLLQYDFSSRGNAPVRRCSTGSSRAKSQEKLAKILGWNTNTSLPEWKTARPSHSAENLVSPISTTRSHFTQPSPSSWHTDSTELTSPDSTISSHRRRRSSGQRSDSIASTSSRVDQQPYDYQMRQFLVARPYSDKDKSRARDSSDTNQDSCDTPRSGSPQSAGGPVRRLSNPNVHKPLPTTPALPAFPNSHPLSQSSMVSNSMSLYNQEDDYSPIMELSAEEASILLSQPEPTELPTDSVMDRAELAGNDSLASTANRIRSKSPTQPRSGSAASAVNEFGPGHTLSVIEEEPWSTEDLAQFQVFELPAHSGPEPGPSPEVPGSSGDASCPSLSPSSSLSSRKFRVKESENDAELEEQADSVADTDVTPTQTTPEMSESSETRPEEPEAEGEEIIVIYDHGTKPHQTDMNGRSFLSLDDEDTEEEATDTEESFRQSRRNSTRQSMRSARGWPFPDGDARNSKYDRRTSSETTKTAWTTNSERTFVDPDYSGDLAKNEWL